MQDEKLVAAERQLVVCPAAGIRKLDFVNVGAENFDDSSDLPPNKPVIWQIASEGDDIEETNLGHQAPPEARVCTTAIAAAGPESRRWQATNWPGCTSCIGGSSFEQRSKA